MPRKNPKLRACQKCGSETVKGQGRRYCDACRIACSASADIDHRSHACPICRSLYQSNYLSENPHLVEEKRRLVKARKYNMTYEQVVAAEAIHNCEACGDGVDLVIDHNHTTGNYRGVLCNHCNKALGFARDNSERLRALASYLDEKGSY